MPLETYEQFESAARALIQKFQYAQPPRGGNGEGSTRQDADGKAGLVRRRAQDGSIPVTSGWRWVSGVQHKVSTGVRARTLLQAAIWPRPLRGASPGQRSTDDKWRWGATSSPGALGPAELCPKPCHGLLPPVTGLRVPPLLPPVTDLRVTFLSYSRPS